VVKEPRSRYPVQKTITSGAAKPSNPKKRYSSPTSGIGIQFKTWSKAHEVTMRFRLIFCMTFGVFSSERHGASVGTR